jgi:hypothetical protein
VDLEQAFLAITGVPDQAEPLTMLINFATAELTDVVQRTDAETRNLLTRMAERGWVQPRGEGKSRNWHLSAAVYRALDAPSGYQEAGGRVLRAQPPSGRPRPAPTRRSRHARPPGSQQGKVLPARRQTPAIDTANDVPVRLGCPAARSVTGFHWSDGTGYATVSTSP